MEQRSSFSFPAGVSGFWSKKDPAPSPFAPALFEDRCAQARALDFELKAVALAQQPKRSYHLALLEKPGEQLVVFCNKYYPLVAFFVPPVPILPEKLHEVLPPPVYVAHPELAQLFAQAPFQVIPAEVLALEVDADNPATTGVVCHLYDAEFAEFAFWEPRAMGDVAFNNWG